MPLACSTTRAESARHFRDSINTGHANAPRDNCNRLTSEMEEPERDRRHHRAYFTTKKRKNDSTHSHAGTADTPRIRRYVSFPGRLTSNAQNFRRCIYMTIRIHMQILEWSFIATAKWASHSPLALSLVAR